MTAHNDAMSVKAQTSLNNNNKKDLDLAQFLDVKCFVVTQFS